MALSKAQINRLIEAVKRHVNWLVYTLGGEASLTPEELEQLKKDKLLPTGFDVNLVGNSYVLGMLRMLLKKADYSKLTFEQLMEAVDRDMTPVEKLAVQHAMHSAGTHLKRLGQDIADGAYDAILSAANSTLTEASVRDLVKDEVAFALLKRKNYMAVATDLSHNLKTDWRRDWRRVAETELHRAKVQGQVQAIVSKVDVYAHAEGPESRVSVVPAPDRCVDCHHYYLDSSGNPKIFTLSELIAAGSNGDEGVSHKRSGGKHVHWKTTLPPLHPRCGCNLVYIPPGYGWVDGRLRLVDTAAYKASLKKSLLSKGNGTSVDTDSGKTFRPLKPKATPLGAPANKDNATPAAPPSVPGVDSPGRTAAGGRPPAASVGLAATQRAGQGQAQQPASAQSDIVDCPLGMQRCQALGGTGKHHSNSATYEEHQQMSLQGMAALGGSVDRTPTAAELQNQPENANGDKFFVSPDEAAQALETAATWDHHAQATAKTLEHLSVGTVAVARRLNIDSLNAGTEDVGVYKLTINGNGSGCFKPERPKRDGINTEGYSNAELTGVVAENTAHKREVAAYKHAASYGNRQVPVTTYRNHEGKEGSIQAWVEGGTTLFETKNELSDEKLANFSWLDPERKSKASIRELHDSFNAVKFLVETSKNPERMKEEICRAIIHDYMTNNTDAHLGNFQVVLGPDGEERLVAYDKGNSFGRGLKNSRNMLGAQMRVSGYPVKIPQDYKTQMENRSFADEVRAIGSDVSKKETAETFLRTKYLLHLQETEGSINHKHFLHQFDYNGTESPDMRELQMLGTEVIDEWKKKSSDRRFTEFAKEYMKNMRDDPTHPHHAEYSALKEAYDSNDRDFETPEDRSSRLRYAQESQARQSDLQEEFSRLREQNQQKLQQEVAVDTDAGATVGRTAAAGKRAPVDQLSDPFKTKR